MKRARGLPPLTMRICREILLRRISIWQTYRGIKVILGILDFIELAIMEMPEI